MKTTWRRIVVDTGLGNDKQGRNVPIRNQRTTPFPEMLTAGALPPTVVIPCCTHLHVDHVGLNTELVDGQWVPTFPKARCVFGKTKYEHWRDHSDEPDKQCRVRRFREADRRCRPRRSDPQRPPDVRGDQHDPDAGHSLGHISILIQSGGEQGSS